MENKDYVAGLRAMADFYEKHPDLPKPFDDGVAVVYVASKAGMVEVARQAGKVEKKYSDHYFELTKQLGAIQLSFFTLREAVCRAIIKGKKTVPSYYVPEHEVDDIEWVCDEPLLAEEKEEKDGAKDTTDNDDIPF